MMAEISRFFTTNNTGDGPSAGYTSVQFQEFIRRTLQTDPTIDGVLYGILNQLVVTGTSSPISVASGAALVYGLYYQNDAANSLTVPTPVTYSRRDYVVLRANMSGSAYTAANSQLFSSVGQTGQTVRMDIIKGTPAASPALPALTQNANQWEIPIAQLVINTSGVIFLSDTRTFAKAAAAPLVIGRQGGSASDFSYPGTNNYTPLNTMMQTGVYQIVTGTGAYTNPWTYSTITYVTFPKFFSYPPMVQLYPMLVTGNWAPQAWLLSVTATQFSFQVAHYTGGAAATGTINCNWLAVGPA